MARAGSRDSRNIHSAHSGASSAFSAWLLLRVRFRLRAARMLQAAEWRALLPQVVRRAAPWMVRLSAEVSREAVPAWRPVVAAEPRVGPVSGPRSRARLELLLLA